MTFYPITGGEDWTHVLCLRPVDSNGYAPLTLIELPKGEFANIEGFNTVRIAAKRLFKREQQREPNPHDALPGPGYNTLQKNGAYISHKSQEISHVSSPRPIVILDQLGTSNPTWKFWVSTNFYLPPRLGWNEDHPAYRRARTQALLNLYASLGKRQKINLGVILGELGKTMSLLGTTLTAFLSFFNAIRRGRVNDAIKVLRNHGVRDIPASYRNRVTINKHRKATGQKPLTKAEYASNAWLELQFGWKPLLKDIDDYISIIQEKVTDPDASPWLSYSGYGEAFSTDIDPGFSGGLLSSAPRVYSSHKSTVHYRVALTATYKLSGDALAYLTKFGLINPLSVVWELVPFSFVVDWFIPVGNWIDSFTASAGLELIEVTPSIKKVEFHEWRDIYCTGSSNTEPITDKYPVLEAYTEQFVRLPGELTDVPNFPSSIASFEDILQPWKLITASALIKQLRRS